MGVIDPTPKATTLNDFRMRFLRLYHGATDEHSDESVPAEGREEFQAHVQWHREAMEEWFEGICKELGSPDGKFLSIPESQSADVLRYVGHRLARHLNACEFELDLLKIEQAEALDESLGIAEAK
jgi:hypothetical protein